MELTFLGTSSMVPTRDRNQVAVLLKLMNYDILIDCGEGTQRQMKIAGLKHNRIRKILITHWHGDHVLGLCGLIQTMSSFEYHGQLEIYGPKGSKKYFKNMLACSDFYSKMDVKVIECTKGKISSDENYEIHCAEMVHSTKCINYFVKEKDKYHIQTAKANKIGISGPLLGKLSQGKDIMFNGKKIKCSDVTTLTVGKKVAFITDTEICDNCFVLAKDADLLVCESTFMSDMEERAGEVQHMSTHQAATIANQSNVKKLVITHFSQRYHSTSDLENDAREVFANTTAAHDFMKIRV